MEGQLNESDNTQLNGLLREHPELLIVVRQHLEISELISHQKPLRSSEHVISELNNHFKSLPREEDIFVENLFERIRHRRLNRRLLIAAAVIALAIPGALLALRTSAPVVAQATLLDSSGNYSTHEGVREGEHIDLKSGLMRLEFGNGAVVAVESPAKFEVSSAKLINLKLGKLNAWCPESAHGFQVVTSETTLTDIGTAFGIDADPNGSSTFIVLEGSVKLKKNNQVHLLEEGTAMSTDQHTGLRNSTFETAPYVRTWAVNSGIVKTTGAVRPAKPDTPERLAKLYNDTEVMVIPEGRDLSFDQKIVAEISTPGHLEITTETVPTHSIPPVAGLRLNSYLVRVDPESKLKGAEHIYFQGSVTFDQPVIAIILGNSTLRETDIRFGNGKWPRIPGSHLRGLEMNYNTSIHDEVSLSEDRRTVTIAFQTGGSSDDIRVITAK